MIFKELWFNSQTLIWDSESELTEWLIVNKYLDEKQENFKHILSKMKSKELVQLSNYVRNQLFLLVYYYVDVKVLTFWKYQIYYYRNNKKEILPLMINSASTKNIIVKDFVVTPPLNDKNFHNFHRGLR